jgi:hypothetical protein
MTMENTQTICLICGESYSTTAEHTCKETSYIPARHAAQLIDHLRLEIKQLRMDLQGEHNVNAYLNRQNIDVAKEIGELRDDNRRMAISNEAMDIALRRIISWCDAYPLDVFPEPDFKRARELLEAGGITLDSVNASNMRHVINGFRDLAKFAIDALKEGEA